MAFEKPSRTEVPLQYFMENEYPSIIEVFHWVANLAGSVYTDSTGVVPPEAAYSSVSLSRTHLLSQEYLLNCKRSSLDLGLPLGISGYFGFPARSSISLRALSEEEDRDRSGEVIELPPYQKLNASLGVTIRARRSLRQFSGKTLPLSELSTILFYASGVTGEVALVSEESDPQWPSYSFGEPPAARTRAASSGGGLNPISLYLVLQNVEKLEDGVYVYLPFGHALKRVAALDDEKRKQHHILGLSWGTNVDASKANVALYYVYSVYENSRKYGDMGLMFAAIEAGEIAAHVHLVCTALQVASSDMGGWEKVPTERYLGLDGLSKHVVHTTAIGVI